MFKLFKKKKPKEEDPPVTVEGYPIKEFIARAEYLMSLVTDCGGIYRHDRCYNEYLIDSPSEVVRSTKLISEYYSVESLYSSRRLPAIFFSDGRYVMDPLERVPLLARVIIVKYENHKSGNPVEDHNALMCDDLIQSLIRLFENDNTTETDR